MRLDTDHNRHMNHKKIRRIMRVYGLVCRVRRKNPYRNALKRGEEHLAHPNVLDRKFTVTKTRTVLCTDITYLYFGAGRVAYLSAVKDIASGEIVAFAVSMNLEVTFVLDTIKQLEGVGIQEGCLIHSDQGCHYTSGQYQEVVSQLRLTISMSRKGTCIDNSPMETFFGHFKDELEYADCTTFRELVSRVTQYMQYYNHKRRQWHKNKMTPVEYRDHLLAQAV